MAKPRAKRKIHEPAAAVSPETVQAQRAARAPTALNTRLFDARPDRLDFRDLPYRPPLRSLPPSFPDDGTVAKLLPGYVRAGLVLNQGNEGACTGFGLACVANYLLWRRHVMQARRIRFLPVSPRMFYELARRYDEWPGERYDGSSCRGALKGWHKHGVCAEALWPYAFGDDGKPVFVPPEKGWELDAATRTLGVYYRVDKASVVDLQAAIAEIGAVYVSCQVHDGWDTLAKARAQPAPRSHRDLLRAEIPPPKNPGKLGGHAFALVGYNERGFVVQNSWGAGWGAGGFALLPYEDWIAHATDAWACALGVPVLPSKARLAGLRWPVPGGQSLGVLDPATRTPDNPADDPWPVDHAYAFKAYEPWSTAQAYAHTLVSGNDGRVVVRDFEQGVDADAGRYVSEIACEAPWRAFRAGRGTPPTLVIYAHGGLNGEEASIRRIRAMAPHFAANGIYPLFLTWRTGAGETLYDIVEDWARKAVGSDAERAAGVLAAIGDVRDRAVEVFARLFGRGVWGEMRENAALGMAPGHGLDLLAQRLLELARRCRKAGTPLRLHLVGHSAGSILLGHLLQRLNGLDAAGGGLAVRSCSLYAAACSVRFAVQRYLAADDSGLLPLRNLFLYHLSDRNEKADALPSPKAPAYGKSLLYLVSRALDDVRKMPLLGMERALDPAYAHSVDHWAEEELPFVQQWQARWPAAQGQIITDPTVRTTAHDNRIQATHGSFDNNLEVIGETIRRIRGAPLVAPLEWLDY
ncbi:C1 family peptidase [Solimonas soli]|uniref:C1 family peptidase n=1 Tax=Solimonas soli TaxID=413479 RepID=UPI0004B471CF|nr:C1 family peptidase [Solimonas soli]